MARRSKKSDTPTKPPPPAEVFELTPAQRVLLYTVVSDVLSAASRELLFGGSTTLMRLTKRFDDVEEEVMLAALRELETALNWSE